MTAFEEVGHLYDIPVDVDVELDRKKMTVRDILSFDQGGIIKMVRSAGENIEIYVGGALLGSGEIVIIEEAVGVRITDFNEED
ncbi:MAG TPA: FliM/FliN family flagellar motor switch protein [Bryobacteraceae bacterium]|nr:FliM/FliN family flagellar motor switch protein [Bryobacteraceae bacterium]